MYEIFIIKPDPSPILFHSFVPSFANNNSVFLAVGVIGATVMPHALFVHSWLTKNKAKTNLLKKEDGFETSSYRKYCSANYRRND